MRNTEQRVVDLYETRTDLDARGIALEAGCAVQTVRDYLSKNGLGLRQNRVSLKSRIFEAHEQHPEWTARQIAEAVGCNRQTVVACAFRAGLKLQRERKRRVPA